MTTRTDAAGYAEAWAARADRHATDFRDVSYAVSLTDPKQLTYHAELRVNAEAMALMWATVAGLLPDSPSGTIAFPDTMSDDDRARFIAAWANSAPEATR